MGKAKPNRPSKKGKNRAPHKATETPVGTSTSTSKSEGTMGKAKPNRPSKKGKNRAPHKATETPVGTSTSTSKSEGTVFNDPVHGPIKLDETCVKIINTPEFQRLRNIKQLGAGYYVYPGACHNRFEHSLGVCYLAEKLVKKLQEQNNDSTNINIDDQDVKCVAIAGLCHDLGHGPFSHLFDNLFLKRARTNNKIKHEQLSVTLTKRLIERLQKDGILNELSPDDVLFIGELIDTNEGKTSERRLLKKFLYEIVSNKETGIDVDKWDYFARDCHYLGIANNFNHLRAMEFLRLIKTKYEGENEEQYHICYRDKQAINLYDMFHTRYMLHERAYQHKTVKIIEEMICDAFIEVKDVDNFVEYKNHDTDEQQICTLSDAIHYMEAYVTLSDSIFDKILYSTQPELEVAREIMQRIHRRDLYKCVAVIRAKQGESIIDENDEKKKISTVKNDLVAGIDAKSRVNKDTLKIIPVTINYGKKDKDPIKGVKLFYTKQKPDTAIALNADEVSALLPQTFSQQIVYICRTGSIEGGHMTVIKDNITKLWDKERCHVVFNE